MVIYILLFYLNNNINNIIYLNIYIKYLFLKNINIINKLKYYIEIILIYYIFLEIIYNDLKNIYIYIFKKINIIKI